MSIFFAISKSLHDIIVYAKYLARKRINEHKHAKFFLKQEDSFAVFVSGSRFWPIRVCCKQIHTLG